MPIKCNRKACSNTNAQWFNHSTRDYYCGDCALLLNRENRDEAMKLYGHDLCTLMAFYYYTKWKFKPECKPPDLNYGEIFHSTCITTSPPEEFFSSTRISHLEEFFYKQFSTREEMESYFSKIS